MTDRTIIITRQDMDRLRGLIRDARDARAEAPAHLKALENELDKAQIVEPAQVPADVVTMNSTVKLRMQGSRSTQKWKIVYPHEADVNEDRISILSPLGTALIGYKRGDEITLELPAGQREVVIQDVIDQPEAKGEFHL